MKFKRYGLLVMATLLAAVFHIGCGGTRESFVVQNSNNNNGGNANTINQVASGQFFGVSTVFDVSANNSGRATNLRGDFNLDGVGGIGAGGAITFLDHAGQAQGAHLGGTYTINANGLLNAVIGSLLGDINLIDGGLIGGLTVQNSAQFASAILRMDNGASAGTAYFVPRGTGLSIASLNGNFVFTGQNNTRVRNRGFVTGTLRFDGNGNVTAATLRSAQLRANFGGAGDFTLAAPATYTVNNNGDFSADLNFGLFTYQLRGAVGASGRLLVTAVINNQASGTWRVKPSTGVTPRRARLAGVRAQTEGGSDPDQQLCTLNRNYRDLDSCDRSLTPLTDKSPLVQATNESNTFIIGCNFIDEDNPSSVNDTDTFSITGTVIVPNALVNSSGTLTYSGLQRDSNGVSVSFTNTTSDFTVLADDDGTLTIDVTFDGLPFSVQSDCGNIFNFDLTVTDPTPAPTTTPSPSPSPTANPNQDLTSEFAVIRAEQILSGPFFFDLTLNSSSTLVFNGVTVTRSDNPTADFNAVQTCSAFIFNGTSSASFDTETINNNECQWLNNSPLTSNDELGFSLFNSMTARVATQVMTPGSQFLQVGENVVLRILDGNAQSIGTVTIPVQNASTN